jgi:DNA-binding cell septation regulator SpoVG
MKIENIKTKLINKKNIEYSVEATINDIQVKDMKIVKGSNGRFLSMPSRDYINAEGRKKYYSIVYLNEEDLKELQEAVFGVINGQAVSKQESKDEPYINFNGNIELSDEDIAF